MMGLTLLMTPRQFDEMMRREMTEHAQIIKHRKATMAYNEKQPHDGRSSSRGYREETMHIDRRQLMLPALAIGVLSTVPALAGSPDEEAVAKNVEAFRQAQLARDAKALDALCAAELSYSHSDARVEEKATFIANATNNKSKFLSLEYKDAQIRVVGPAAIVRFHWVAEGESIPDGKKTSTNLHILMNWQKQGAEWKLLSRASTKL
jgi:ketosteroid isomerase-like protein